MVPIYNWPATIQQLNDAGFLYSNTRICGKQGCNVEVENFDAPNRTLMPLNRLIDGRYEPHYRTCKAIRSLFQKGK